MDVMLGLIPPDAQLAEESQCLQVVNFNDPKKCNYADDSSLNDAVNDFERTLQRSKVKYPNNLPDVTAVSGSILLYIYIHNSVELRNFRQRLFRFTKSLKVWNIKKKNR